MTVLNTVQSVSIIFASLVASAAVIYGVKTWRREYIGKRRIELAEEVLVLFYEARDVISDIRNPFSYPGEAETRNSPDNEPLRDKIINDRIYLFYKRYYQRRELFAKIESIKYRYMAQFGEDSAKPFQDLSAILGDMWGSALWLADYLKDASLSELQNPQEIQRRQDEISKHEAVLRRISPHNELITPRLEAVISEIEVQSARIIGKSK